VGFCGQLKTLVFLFPHREMPGKAVVEVERVEGTFTVDTGNLLGCDHAVDVAGEALKYAPAPVCVGSCFHTNLTPCFVARARHRLSHRVVGDPHPPWCRLPRMCGLYGGYTPVECTRGNLLDEGYDSANRLFPMLVRHHNVIFINALFIVCFVREGRVRGRRRH
jgi:hypothetical protein